VHIDIQLVSTFVYYRTGLQMYNLSTIGSCKKDNVPICECILNDFGVSMHLYVLKCLIYEYPAGCRLRGKPEYMCS